MAEKPIYEVNVYIPIFANLEDVKTIRTGSKAEARSIARKWATGEYLGLEVEVLECAGGKRQYVQFR